MFLYSFKLCKNCSKDRDGRLSDSSFLCGVTGEIAACLLVFFLYNVIRDFLSIFLLSLDLKRVIYELLWHVIRGDLKQEDALTVLADIKVIFTSFPILLATTNLCLFFLLIRSNIRYYFPA